MFSWDFYFLKQTSTAINILLRTAVVGSHTYFGLFSFSFVSKYFLFLLSFLQWSTVCLATYFLASTCLCFLQFSSYSWYLLLFWFPLLSWFPLLQHCGWKKMLAMISILLNLLVFAHDLSWRMFHASLRRMCSLLLDEMFYKYELSLFHLMYHLRLVFLYWFFHLDDLSTDVSGCIKVLQHYCYIVGFSFYDC